MPLHHPKRSQIALSAVLEALSDPIRRVIVQRLSHNGERSCSAFLSYASKTKPSYHLAPLRTTRLLRIPPEGPCPLLPLLADPGGARLPWFFRTLIATRITNRAGGRPRAATS